MPHEKALLKLQIQELEDHKCLVYATKLNCIEVSPLQAMVQLEWR